MSLISTVLTTPSDLTDTGGGIVLGSGLTVTCIYLLARLLTPLVLIFWAARGASPKQRMKLVRDYLVRVSSKSHDVPNPQCPQKDEEQANDE